MQFLSLFFLWQYAVLCFHWEKMLLFQECPHFGRFYKEYSIMDFIDLDKG